MFNKKGGIAIEEIRGVLTFLFVAVIVTLIFYGCSVSKITREYKELKFSKEEIEATKALNFFLEMPVDEERKVSDVFVESYFKEDYSELEELNIEEYFSNSFRGWILYITYHYPEEDWSDRREDSKTLLYSGGTFGGTATLSWNILPILKESGGTGSIDIALETYYTEPYDT